MRGKKMNEDILLWFLCGCYLVGGLTIGYLFREWKAKRSKGVRTGVGRWDYKDRHLGGDDYV